MAKKKQCSGGECDLSQSSEGTQQSQPEVVIRELAYYKWEAAGCPPTDGVEFWLQAEQEFSAKTTTT